jgi:hypothetical protein
VSTWILSLTSLVLDGIAAAIFNKVVSKVIALFDNPSSEICRVGVLTLAVLA